MFEKYIYIYKRVVGLDNRVRTMYKNKNDNKKVHFDMSTKKNFDIFLKYPIYQWNNECKKSSTHK